MNEEQLKSIVDANLEKIVALGLRGVYPFAFVGSASPRREYSVDSAIVNNQLVFTPTTQILCFLIMDLTNTLLAAQKLFPKMPRNESLKMVVSANNEIINSASSKLGMVLSRAAGNGEVTVTPPLVMNHTGENRLPLNVSDCLFWTFRSECIVFDFIIAIQKI
ncbi:MAG: hypothetical protein M3Y08_00420 [Fibrobacterota bacterium]|nr:hypothetical protein [Fibrobacterota bacterium]